MLQAPTPSSRPTCRWPARRSDRKAGDPDARHARHGARAALGARTNSRPQPCCRLRLPARGRPAGGLRDAQIGRRGILTLVTLVTALALLWALGRTVDRSHAAGSDSQLAADLQVACATLRSEGGGS